MKFRKLTAALICAAMTLTPMSSYAYADETAAEETADRSAAGTVGISENSDAEAGVPVSGGQDMAADQAGISQDSADTAESADRSQPSGAAADESADVTPEAVPADGTADEDEVLIGETRYWVSPWYEGDLSELTPDLSGIQAQDTSVPSVTASTEEEALAAFKQMLMDREEAFYITYVSAEAIDLDDFINSAYAHTGEPTEGDYLRFSIQGTGYSYRGSYAGGGKYAITYSFTVIPYSTSAQESALTTELTSVMAGLNLEGKSDYQKVKLIYDYILEHVTYDHDHLNDSSYLTQFTAYAALINGTAVCQGYALLLYRMLLTAGIDCRIISGIANGGGHAWNIIKLGDYYYNADATWDVSPHKYGYYYYFLKGDASDNTFVTSHDRALNDAVLSYYQQIADANGVNISDVYNAGTDIDYSGEAFYTSYPMASADYDPSHTHSWGEYVSDDNAT